MMECTVVLCIFFVQEQIIILIATFLVFPVTFAEYSEEIAAPSLISILVHILSHRLPPPALFSSCILLHLSLCLSPPPPPAPSPSLHLRARPASSSPSPLLSSGSSTMQ